MVGIWGWSLGTWFLLRRNDCAGLRLICWTIKQLNQNTLLAFAPFIRESSMPSYLSSVSGQTSSLEERDRGEWTEKTAGTEGGVEEDWQLVFLRITRLFYNHWA